MGFECEKLTMLLHELYLWYDLFIYLFKFWWENWLTMLLYGFYMWYDLLIYLFQFGDKNEIDCRWMKTNEKNTGKMNRPKETRQISILSILSNDMSDCFGFKIKRKTWTHKVKIRV